MLLFGEGSEATEPFNKYDKIRPHSIRSLQFDQKVRRPSFRPENFDLFTVIRLGFKISLMVPFTRFDHSIIAKNEKWLVLRRVWIPRNIRVKFKRFFAWAYIVGLSDWMTFKVNFPINVSDGQRAFCQTTQFSALLVPTPTWFLVLLDLNARHGIRLILLTTGEKYGL